MRQPVGTDFQIYEIEINNEDDANSVSFEFERIGRIKYIDSPFVGFHLMKEEQYGILLNEADVIVYFEFDTSEVWDKTTGGKNGKTAAVI